MTKKEAFDKIDSLLKEYSVKDWDGYGADSLSEGVCLRVKKFIDLLSEEILPSEILPDTDGEIDLQWFRDNKWQFSVSIGEKGLLTFAAIFNDYHSCGEEMFDGGIIPIRIFNYIFHFKEGVRIKI